MRWPVKADSIGSQARSLKNPFSSRISRKTTRVRNKSVFPNKWESSIFTVINEVVINHVWAIFISFFIQKVVRQSCFPTTTSPHERPFHFEFSIPHAKFLCEQILALTTYKQTHHVSYTRRISAYATSYKMYFPYMLCLDSVFVSGFVCHFCRPSVCARVKKLLQSERDVCLVFNYSSSTVYNTYIALFNRPHRLRKT